MDLSKLSPGERIIAAAGTLLLLDALLLPWFRYCLYLVIRESCGSRRGFDNPLSSLAVLLAVAMVAQIGISRFTATRMSPPGNFTWGQAQLFAGFAVVALILLQLLSGDNAGGYAWRRGIGLYLAVLLSAAIAYGGMVRSRESEPTVEGGPT